MGWLGAALQTAVPILGGRAAGQNQGYLLQRQFQQEDADRKAKEAQAALQAALIHSQIGFNERRSPEEWKPQTEEEYGRVHPVPPRNIDPLSEGGISAAFKRHQDERRFDASHPIPSGASAVEYDPNDPKNRQKFLAAYVTRTSQGHRNAEGDYEEPAPAQERLKEAEDLYSTLARMSSPDYNPQDDAPAREAEGWHAPMRPGQDPSELPAQGAPTAPTRPYDPPGPHGPTPGGKRPISTDQKAYLEATGQWDASRYEVK